MLTNVFIGNINKKVSINFIIEGTSYIVKINRGSSISKDIIPLSNKNYVVKLYYDEEDKIEYNNEGVKEGTTIFVDTNISLESAKPVVQILTLQEAYNKNILTKEDLYQIQYNINDYCYGDTYMNIIKGIYTCEWISEDLIRQIVYDKESQLNPACEGCLEFEVIKNILFTLVLIMIVYFLEQKVVDHILVLIGEQILI